MTDIEFDILDELYFIKSFSELTSALTDFDSDVKKVLWEMLEKEWIRVIDDLDNELTLSKEEFLSKLDTNKFIATKKGLLAHNQV